MCMSMCMSLGVCVCVNMKELMCGENYEIIVGNKSPECEVMFMSEEDSFDCPAFKSETTLLSMTQVKWVQFLIRISIR